MVGLVGGGWGGGGGEKKGKHVLEFFVSLSLLVPSTQTK